MPAATSPSSMRCGSCDRNSARHDRQRACRSAATCAQGDRPQLIGATERFARGETFAGSYWAFARQWTVPIGKKPTRRRGSFRCPKARRLGRALHNLLSMGPRSLHPAIGRQYLLRRSPFAREMSRTNADGNSCPLSRAPKGHRSPAEDLQTITNPCGNRGLLNDALILLH